MIQQRRNNYIRLLKTELISEPKTQQDLIAILPFQTLHIPVLRRNMLPAQYKVCHLRATQNFEYAKKMF